MRLQIGKKTIDEIKTLIETNCWKSMFWIHSLLLTQLQYLFYYTNQVKQLGHKNVDLRLNKEGFAKAEIKLDDVEEHNKKWRKMEERLRSMDMAIDLCYARSLIDDEYENLKKFNKFRNKKMGHPTVSEYLPSDEEIKEICKLGLDIVEKLDLKINNALRKPV